jgi:2'-5' RNA ligase
MTSGTPTRSSVFPADPPPSLTDPDVIAEHDWAAFSAVTTMANHWDRSGWASERRHFYWFLTVEHAPDVHRLAEQCQRQLSQPELDLTAIDGLHITLSRIGTSDEETLARLAGVARAQCAELEPFVIQAIPLAGSRGAVRFSLAPWEPLLQLHDLLINAGSAVGLTAVNPTSDFRPHLGIAYCKEPAPAAPLHAAMAGLRRLGPAELPVRTVKLVELHRDGRRYHWTTMTEIFLGRKERSVQR